MKRKKETYLQVETELKKHYPDLSVTNEALELLGNVVPRKTRKVNRQEINKRF